MDDSGTALRAAIEDVGIVPDTPDDNRASLTVSLDQFATSPMSRMTSPLEILSAEGQSIGRVASPLDLSSPQ